jgi:hypothetical protein
MRMPGGYGNRNAYVHGGTRRDDHRRDYLGHRQLFIGTQCKQAHARARRRQFRDYRRIFERVAIQVFVERRAEKIQALQTTMPYERAVLTDTARESNGIDAAHRRCIRADVLANSMRIHVERQPAIFVALGRTALDFAHIDRARHADETGLSREQLFERATVMLAQQLEQDAWIEVACPRSHDETFERRHTHARFDTAPVFDRRNARAVAQMTGNDSQVAR